MENRTRLSVLVAVALCALPAIAQQGRIEGRVVSARDGSPIAGAAVSVRVTRGEAPSPADPYNPSFMGTTDGEGRYAIAVDAGRYVVYADRDGFVRRFYGMPVTAASAPPRAFDVAAGDARGGLDIELLPGGSISGRVLNQDGEAVSGASVTAVRASYADGVRRTMPTGVMATSAADGVFRIAPLPPGQYFLVAEVAATSLRIGGRAGQGPAAQRALRRTYYPQSDAFETALAVRVAMGREAQGVDIHMPWVDLFRVSGKVDWGGDAPPARASMWMRGATRSDLALAAKPYLSLVAADGTFQFEEVPPGSYFLEPQPDFREDSYQGRMTVEVRDEDMSGLELRLLRAAPVTGRVQLEKPVANAGVAVSAVRPVANLPERNGAPPPPPPPGAGQAARPDAAGAPAVPPPPAAAADDAPAGAAGAAAFVPAAPAIVPKPRNTSPVGAIQVTLNAADRVPIGTPLATSDADGRFRIVAVAPGRYRVGVDNLPAGAYVKSIVFNGQDVSKGTADLSGGFGGQIDVTLSPGAGGVSGVVRDAERQPLPAVWVSVWRPSRNGDAQVHVVATDAQGAFRVENLAPGEYRAVAWAQMDAGLAGVAAFCDQFAGEAKPVKVDVGGRATVELEPVPLARIEAAGRVLPF